MTIIPRIVPTCHYQRVYIWPVCEKHLPFLVVHFFRCNVLIIHLYASRVLTCMICDNEQMSSLSTGLFFFLIVRLHNMLIRKNEFVSLDDFKIHLIKKKKREIFFRKLESNTFICKWYLLMFSQWWMKNYWNFFEFFSLMVFNQNENIENFKFWKFWFINFLFLKFIWVIWQIFSLHLLLGIKLWD